MFLSECMQIRFPEVIFKASEDGYNIRNMYKKCDEYIDSYEHAIILIQSEEGTIMGAYLDFMPEIMMNKFQGSGDSFVFTLQPQLNKFTAHEPKQIDGKP
jgi:hypothetical protein